jgi:hypothetical protein
MDDDERYRLHEEMLQGMARMWERQGEINLAQQEITERLTLAIERIDRTLAHVEITQARMETLLARMLRQEDNGREA